MKEGTKPLNGDGEEEETPLPPTQTLPATLAATARARTASTCPTLDDDHRHAGRDGLSGRQRRDADRLARIPLFTSAVQLGVKTDGWLMKQDDLRLNFVALDTEGKPIARARRSRSRSTAARS